MDVLSEYARREAKGFYDSVMNDDSVDQFSWFAGFKALFEIALIDQAKTEKNKIAFVQDTLHEIEQYVVSEIRKEGEKWSMRF